VVWFPCLGCRDHFGVARRLKSTWFIRETESSCRVCASEVRFAIVPGDELLFDQALRADSQRILRTGTGFHSDCIQCGSSIGIEQVLTDAACPECSHPHHLEIVFGIPDKSPVIDSYELCLSCDSWYPAKLVDTHHVSYENPEKYVRVCRECHMSIHESDEHPLKPVEIPDGSMEKSKEHPWKID